MTEQVSEWRRASTKGKNINYNENKKKTALVQQQQQQQLQQKKIILFDCFRNSNYLYSVHNQKKKWKKEIDCVNDIVSASRIGILLTVIGVVLSYGVLSISQKTIKNGALFNALCDVKHAKTFSKIQ